MSSAESKVSSRFLRVIQGFTDWATIDEILDACDSAGVFADEEIDDMVTVAKKSAIRRMLRSLSKSRPSDLTEQQQEWVNILVSDRDGNEIRVYKQLTLFNEGDFVQVVRDRRSRVEYWEREVSRFVKQDGSDSPAVQRGQPGL